MFVALRQIEQTMPASKHDRHLVCHASDHIVQLQRRAQRQQQTLQGHGSFLLTVHSSFGGLN